MGELLLGILNNVCTLYYPYSQIQNDSPTTAAKVYKQFSMSMTPSSFCINSDASVLACSLPPSRSEAGLFHSTIQLFNIDVDVQPHTTFIIPEDAIPLPVDS